TSSTLRQLWSCRIWPARNEAGPPRWDYDIENIVQPVVAQRVSYLGGAAAVTGDAKAGHPWHVVRDPHRQIVIVMEILDQRCRATGEVGLARVIAWRGFQPVTNPPGLGHREAKGAEFSDQLTQFGHLRAPPTRPIAAGEKHGETSRCSLVRGDRPKALDRVRHTRRRDAKGPPQDLAWLGRERPVEAPGEQRRI